MYTVLCIVCCSVVRVGYCTSELAGYGGEEMGDLSRVRDIHLQRVETGTAGAPTQ